MIRKSWSTRSLCSRDVPARPGIPFILLLPAVLVFSSSLLGGEEGELSLRLLVRDSFRPGVPILVRAELKNADGSLARQVWDAEAALSVTGSGATINPDRVTLRNGIGSALVDLDASGEVTLTAGALGLETSRTLARLGEGAPVTTVSGELQNTLTEWSGIVRVTGDVTVPAGYTLTVKPGTLILIDGVSSGEDGKDINVEGTLNSLGTEEQPITFTAADPALPWGEIDHDGADPSDYRYTVITRAGHSPRGGHTNTGPAVRARGGSPIVFEHCSFTDHAGKIMQTSSGGADLEFRECLLARAVMGPEIAGTALLFESSYIMEMYGSNDNDGIYIHDQGAGQAVTIRGAIIASGHDDGIDTLSSEVLVEDSIIRDWMCDKGISVFNGEVTIHRSLVVDNDKGLSAKSYEGNSATVTIDHVTFAGNRWSIEARKKSNAPGPNNSFQITNSIIRHNSAPDGLEGCWSDESNEDVGGRTLRTDFEDSYFDIHYCNLENGFQVEGVFHATWPGPGGNNMDSDPMFLDPPAHDFHLQAISPCIDSGDPADPPDPDSTRTDIGRFYFPQGTSGEPRFQRGELNGDGQRDISDPVKLLFYLFGPKIEISCLDAGDTNDDGDIDVTDVVYFLEYLFLTGEALPSPSAACDEDPTPGDNLGCDSFPGCF